MSLSLTLVPLVKWSSSALPNLGYAHPQGYIINLKVYKYFNKFKISNENVIIYFLPSHLCLIGVRQFYLFYVGYVERKRLGTTGLAFLFSRDKIHLCLHLYLVCDRCILHAAIHLPFGGLPVQNVAIRKFWNLEYIFFSILL